MKFTDRLKDINACSEAVQWVGKRDIIKAWRECPRGDWMLWLAGRLDIDRKLLVLAACDCAETAIQYVPEGEDRPAKAIQTSRNWCNGTASMEDANDAANAAADAADAAADAAANAAADAADAAADAANAAANAAYAADAAADAANAAANAANAGTRKSANLTCADLVRKRIPVSVIHKALRG